MRQTQRKERNKSIRAEFKKMVRRGMALWEAKDLLARKYGMCSQTIHRIVKNS